MKGLVRHPGAIEAWSRLKELDPWLESVLAVAARSEAGTAPAAEWLLDNDFQIRRALLQIGEDMPPGFYARLPGLANKDDPQPRVYDIVHELLHVSHLQIALGPAVHFISAYQERSPLTIAELWAFPTMLRIACIELLLNGSRQLFEAAPPPFRVDKSCLCRAGDATECIARAITNLGVISSIQWKDFFDRTSRVEAILRNDPADIYARMDFATRDQYRRAVETLAGQSSLEEWDVADRALARAHRRRPLPFGHVGYWLVGAGRARLEDSLQSRPPAPQTLARKLLRYPAQIYGTALLLFGLASLILPATYLAVSGASTTNWLLGVLLSALPASMLSVTLVNWIATLLVAPRVLPKLDFEKAIASDCATAVALPVILASLEDARRALTRLEGHFLANPDPMLQFILLSDLNDAGAARHPGDNAIEEALVQGIAALNERHHGTQARFHLLHRHRIFNPAERCWMGWERKRGKLEQLNRLILTGDCDAFPLRAGPTDSLRNVRFIVTADADTRLPPGVVNHMVATLAHPLNQAQFDPQSGRVTSGYTILQPRVEIAPDIEERSLFTRFFGGDTAIDIYSRAVSDVYQDLIGSGIFVGKGIYDVAGFTRSLQGRVPRNALLSHDLFEGLHGRAGLVSDIIIFEGFPSGYLDHARRWHRWVRGDWQIMPWLLPKVPGQDGKRLRNRLNWFDRLKIFDNLRRSLIPPGIFLLLLAGWSMLPGNPLVWTVLAALAPGATLFTDLVTGMASGRRRGVMQSLARRLGDHGGRWLLALAFLVNDAAIAAHAIVVTIWRLTTRAGLLRWTSAAHVSEHFAQCDPRRAAWRGMWISPLVAGAAGAALAFIRPDALAVAAPLLALWLAAPEIAIAIGRPIRPKIEPISPEERLFLRKVARRTWLYFETFVRPEDNWLPPDNYQEPPDEEVAHRTSPTNVGVMLLAGATAWKLGHIGLDEFVARLRNTLTTLGKLDRHRGHMLNWYDTRTLRPLEPRYVSTVDSGNLAVSLVAMSQACREAPKSTLWSSSAWDGLLDELMLLEDSLGSTKDASPSRAIVTGMIAAIRADSSTNARTLRERLTAKHVPALRQAVHDAASQGDLPPGALRDIQLWSERVSHHLHSMAREERRFRPWLALSREAPPEMKGKADALVESLLLEPPLAALGSHYRAARQRMESWADWELSQEATNWKGALAAALESSAAAAEDLCGQLAGLADLSARLAHEMEFGFLFDRDSRLFHIGYNLSADRIDSHHYDLLASEARLASFFAIAKGDVPFEHWFFLGRPITKNAAGLALVSWNGSMFEYLMPTLFLRSDPDTLLGQSDRTAVDLQRAYGERHAVPWGISESGYASMGSDRAYRYHAFGVPRLGLRRGLERDLVIAPYACVLALAIRPAQAIANLRALEALGMIGRYGFYEAADFTPGRVPEGHRAALVRSYMVHHHGMSLAAIGNALCGDMLVRWFHADPHVRTVDLLLNERIPWELPPEMARAATPDLPAAAAGIPALHAWQADCQAPCLHVIGNGRLTTFLGSNGSGMDWQGVRMTASTPGPWLYFRQAGADPAWSPLADLTAPNEDDRIQLHADRIEFHGREQALSVTAVIGIGHGDDVEIRHIALVNESDQSRTIELIGYAEVVLAPARDAVRHPAFNKLFIQSEALSPLDGLLFSRRARSPDEHPPVMLCRIIGDDDGFERRGFETDRARFLGRLGSVFDPEGARADRLTDSLGWTLDPCAAQRIALTVPAGGRREVAFLTVAAPSHATAIEIAERYATLASLQWALDDAAAHTARDMHQLGLMPDLVPQAHRLVAQAAGPDIGRAPIPPLPALEPGRAALWSLGISGDDPMIVLRVTDGRTNRTLRFLIALQKLCRLRGVSVDLVIIHEGEEGYVDPVRERVLELLREAGVQDRIGQRSGIHLIATLHMSADLLHRLERSARLVLSENGGPLDEQVARGRVLPLHRPLFAPIAPKTGHCPSPALERPARLVHDNGIGGFTQGGETYVIHLEPGEATPGPWSNILANEGFGTIVTEAGLGFSWAVNAGENRLTPWSNDPVCDPQGECLYLRDEENGRVWSVSPAPAGRDVACRITHGAGYTRWTCAREGIEQEMLVFVAPVDPVKIVRLRLRNTGSRARRITATYYAQWLLGAIQGAAAPLRMAAYDPALHAILGRDPGSEIFGNRVAFLTADAQPHSLTTSRTDFLGPSGRVESPQALGDWDLGGRLGSVGDDCCAAYQVHLDVAAKAQSEVVFILGQGADQADAERLIARWQDVKQVEGAWAHSMAQWAERLGAVAVSTPDPAFDIMVNRWLPYQAMSSRLRARAGFYQAGGAFGFRDQLQDVLAFRHCDPLFVRQHILEAAAHQFEQGDVLHWWHPPGGAGVRTRCSDDMLWLPYVTAAYIEASGDLAVLDERIAFLTAPMLAQDEDDRYARFERTDERYSLFDHCERALEHAHRLGRHGLPLIGSGDWNDGMNRIGDEGRGESVWLGWFLIATLRAFTPLCAIQNRPDLVERWERRAEELASAIEASAWDGGWYVRAFDDEGRPWGSASDSECRIDSLAQSWARISGAGREERVQQALKAARDHLVKAEDRLVRLLTPPFDRTPRNPGYIKAYPPGIRENGGQYTHAAAWLGIAFALSGEGDGAMEIFRRINPILQTTSLEDAERYRTEPYVVAADVAGAPPHVGRGGWSWYTGAASWTWRLAIEHILGLKLVAGKLRIDPCLPSAWKSAQATLRGKQGCLCIRIDNPDGLSTGILEILVEGVPWQGGDVSFSTDGTTRQVEIRLRRPDREPVGGSV
ncbi:cellobiose phosphorylase [Sphingobium baderi LL03]|uniref:Uncharacterized protein n=1 Tax=Sphingobium baderi LL03 TaxID=1114964 RepID=T0HX95_9SPHN|nr:hypothetical protein L485_09195 [Sphingobium baderi LL03]KMS58997.1 cellobiose phosphorylase [Sphingobium baderi LL03]